MGGSRLSQRKSIVRPSLFSQPDLIIATTALHHGLTIVTRNLSDYQRVRTPVFNPRVDPLSASAS
jgi:predicted nucleic acid-binding protein